MNILVTGGLGFIGSHTVVELSKSGHDVVIMDNLFNSKEDVLNSIETITGKKYKFYKADVRDKDALNSIFSENKIDAVIHFAGFKAVNESVQKPIMYYSNNLETTLSLLEVMDKYNVKRFVFSSSATVYGEVENEVCTESQGRGIASNPYGTTKIMIEKILEDLYKADNSWDITILRYFNPVGAHESGLIGEDPNGIPNNLMPYILKVAAGELEVLTIFGNDYPTRDGTCIRDFIHVVDLAKGHVKALENAPKGLNYYNLGSGKGITVMEMVRAFEDVNNLKLNYRIGSRREGDLTGYYADASKAYEELGWKTEKNLEDIVRDSWNFKRKRNDVQNND